MHIIGKNGCRLQLCHQFLAIFLLGQDMVMSQMSLYIELHGAPFLDNHYRGYQRATISRILFYLFLDRLLKIVMSGFCV